MMTDLTSIRRWAGFLQKTEIKFDMLSAVDELSKQVHLLCLTSILMGIFCVVLQVCTRAMLLQGCLLMCLMRAGGAGV